MPLIVPSIQPATHLCKIPIHTVGVAAQNGEEVTIVAWAYDAWFGILKYDFGDAVLIFSNPSDRTPQVYGPILIAVRRLNEIYISHFPNS
jgi:hypothetical protein